MKSAESGRIVVLRIESEVLRENPCGDPTERDLHVYLPPGFDEAGGPFPVLLALTGFTGTGGVLFNLATMRESLDEKLDRLILEEGCPPVIVVAPDCFTRFGGSQYRNSSATGRYEDYLAEEIVPFVRDRYPCGRWGVFGTSSGGYGAMVLAMLHPEVFSAVADHSGDSNFELSYLPDCGAALDAFREAGGPAAWLDAFWNDVNRGRRKHHKPLDTLAMAACYSPNPDSPHLGVDLPFDLETGAFRPEVWERWRSCDPVNMVERYAENLKRLDLVYIDCGRADEFHLQWGARALAAELRRHGVEPHYEEFDDGHFSVSYRYDVSVPMLARALEAT